MTPMARDLQAAPAAPVRTVFSVTQLNREVRELLEGSLPLLWVEGEISNLARPASGHLYFSLKDEQAQVRCAMFRTRNTLLAFRPENGMHVVIRARVGLYEPRGEFQIIAEHMEEAGDGALRRAFDALKQRLNAEGLFDAARKRALPELPRRIGVVTSPSGAAIRDILSILQRRFPAIPVVLYPVQVQGQGAAAQIARAIRRAGTRNECDVLIVGRGGGSLEDLWAFNEEVVARAIHESPLPVVSAVGHEIDFTIADFVADCRAPTPSAAAELLSPDRQEWLARLSALQLRLRRAIHLRLQERQKTLEWMGKRLKHPGRRLQEITQRVDELEQRLGHAQRNHLRHCTARLAQLRARLERHTPMHRLERLETHRQDLGRRLHTATVHRLTHQRQRLATLARALDAVSPLATLGRGYAIALRSDGSVLRSSGETAPGERVEVRLAKGQLLCRIEEIDGDSN